MASRGCGGVNCTDWPLATESSRLNFAWLAGQRDSWHALH